MNAPAQDLVCPQDQGASDSRGVELWDGIEWQHFRDGWPNIFIHNVDRIAGKDGAFSVARLLPLLQYKFTASTLSC